MLFSSLTFIFVFLPLVLLCYYLSPDRLKNYVLLLFSFVFYAWGEPKAFFIMLAVIGVNYIFALEIEKRRNLRTLFLVLDLVFSFGFLFYFKYIDFTITTINRVFHQQLSLLNVALPIGISFFIFQAVSYAIDVYRGDCKVQKNPFKLALYISFFPQLVAGPIVKYHDIEAQLNSRTVTAESFASGAKRFLIGLTKKVFVANTVALVADKVFDSFLQVDIPSLWIGALCYSLQIYYDFSGYSDMAIGLGKMFGFKFLENFNYPYISSSITEFWRRWHISLSTWFKEYVYISLGGNRCSKTRTVFNLFVVFLLTGIWHGAANVFIIWGLWHGFFNIFEKLTGLNKEQKKPLVKILMHFYTLFVVFLGWIFFRSNGVGDAVRYILAMFGFFGTTVTYTLSYFLSANTLLFMLIGIIFSMPLFPLIKNKVGTIKAKSSAWFITVNVAEIVVMLVLFVLCAAALAGNTYNPFIYFRF